MLNAVKKLYKKGFTLLELLVVVLIIGILASIALPQYEKAVTKARLAEVLINVKAIEGSVDRYLLKNGFPQGDEIGFQDFGDIELSGGEWESERVYQTDKNSYDIVCQVDNCDLLIYDKDSMYSSAVLDVGWWTDGTKGKQCYTNDIDKGRFICKYLEPLGWEYTDEEY